MNIEKLKEIPNTVGYFISKDEKIFCNQGKGRRDKSKTVELYEIKPRIGKNGYARVYLRDTVTNKRKDYYVHRLVAKAFIPNPDKYKYVNHKDCNRQNNCVDNLEWCTAKYNTDQTINNKHIIRDSKGRYFSNFKYIF